MRICVRCMCVVLAVGSLGFGAELSQAQSVRGRSGAGESPKVKRVAIPDFPGTFAIWGATGRDSRGHIWFGVCGHDMANPTGHLFELIPSTGKVIDRGDLISALKSNGVYREGELQMKIHSKIIQGADGHMYFVSMDENFENLRTETLPKWGGHMWRLRLPENKWEHLLRTREPLIAAAGGKRYLYGLGYFGHVVYQYDIKTGKVRSVRVGSIGGHVSRNILADRREHVYVPRLVETDRGYAASLVEYDTNLKELRATPLKHYIRRNPMNCHGIIGFQPLPDGRIAFLPHHGFLYFVEPPADGDGAATIREGGWFHPGGSSYSPSLFLDRSGKRLMGIATRRGWHQWIVYDLKTRKSKAVPLDIPPRQAGRRYGWKMLYGSATRDDAGNCYVVGKEIIGHKAATRPNQNNADNHNNLGRAEGHEMDEGKRTSISKPIMLQILPADRMPTDGR